MTDDNAPPEELIHLANIARKIITQASYLAVEGVHPELDIDSTGFDGIGLTPEEAQLVKRLRKEADR